MANVKVIRVPRLPSLSRARAGRFARRAGGAVATAAKDEKHTLIAGASAYALGYASRKGTDGKSMLSGIPRIKALGVTGTLAAVAWVGAKYTKSRVLRHIATGFVAVAAYTAGVGDGESVEGDDDGETASGKY